MRIIFMGSPGFAVPTLDALVAAGHEVIAAYTQPPRPAGRGKGERPTALNRGHEPLAVQGKYRTFQVERPRFMERFLRFLHRALRP